MSDTTVPVLLKRRLQAEAIGPVFAEMERELGRARAEAILDAAIRKAAIAEGARFRETLPADTPAIAGFAAIQELWTRGGALEVEPLAQTETGFDFNITRCRYAEMYREMGLGDIGHLLSCNRDGTFAQGFDPDLTLERAQTIMAGAPCCTFRYRLESPDPDPDLPDI